MVSGVILPIVAQMRKWRMCVNMFKSWLLCYIKVVHECWFRIDGSDVDIFGG